MSAARRNALSLRKLPKAQSCRSLACMPRYVRKTRSIVMWSPSILVYRALAAAASSRFALYTQPMPVQKDCIATRLTHGHACGGAAHARGSWLETHAGVRKMLSEEAIATTATASATQPSGPADRRTLPYRGSTGSLAIWEPRGCASLPSESNAPSANLHEPGAGRLLTGDVSPGP